MNMEAIKHADVYVARCAQAILLATMIDEQRIKYIHQVQASTGFANTNNEVGAKATYFGN